MQTHEETRMIVNLVAVVAGGLVVAQPAVLAHRGVVLGPPRHLDVLDLRMPTGAGDQEAKRWLKGCAALAPSALCAMSSFYELLLGLPAASARRTSWPSAGSTPP